MHPCPCAPPVYDFIMVSRPLYVMLCWGALIRGSSTLISSGGSSSPVGNQVSFTNSTLSPLLNSVVHLHHWAIKFSIANYTLFPLLSSLAHPHHQAISFSIANLTLSSLLNFPWFSPLFREGAHITLSVVAAICNLQILTIRQSAFPSQTLLSPPSLILPGFLHYSERAVTPPSLWWPPFAICKFLSPSFPSLQT